MSAWLSHAVQQRGHLDTGASCALAAKIGTVMDRAPTCDKLKEIVFVFVHLCTLLFVCTLQAAKLLRVAKIEFHSVCALHRAATLPAGLVHVILQRYWLDGVAASSWGQP